MMLGRTLSLCRAGAGAAVVAAALLPDAGSAATVRIVVEGLRNDAGDLLVAFCDEAAFLGRGCAHTASAPARDRAVTVTGVPPGTYAVQAFHDENGNGDLDRSDLLPAEGMGFSRDAPMRFGPPRFADAAVEVREPGGTLTLRMRYFQ